MGKISAPRVFGFPEWWHHHGTKIDVLHTSKNSCTLKGSAAGVTITTTDRQSYFLDYYVIHSSDTRVTGRIYMDRAMLLAAFGSRDQIDRFSQWMHDRYGADAASQGAFIRYLEYLNIPGPGTGHDGDANISICLNDDIRDAVLKLLEI